MPSLAEFRPAFALLAPVFRGTRHSMVCGSSALAWLLADSGIDIYPDDIDAVALTDPEFDLLVGRLRLAARSGHFQFDGACPGGWARVPGELARRAAGRLLLPHTTVPFELFDARSRFIGRAVTGEVARGAGIVSIAVAAGLDLPFAGPATLRRINDNVIQEHHRRADPFGTPSAGDLEKRLLWSRYLDLLTS